MYDDQPFHNRALNYPTTLSARQSVVLPVQEEAINYLTDSTRKVCRRCLLYLQECAEWPRLGAFASLVRDDKQPILLDPCSSRIGLLEEGFAACVPILDSLLVTVKRFYSVNALICTQTEEELEKTLVCLMVKDKDYVQFIAKLKKLGIFELVSERREVINGFFSVPRGDNNQRLILDARLENLHLILPDDPELLHPGSLPQLALDNREKLWMGKLDIEGILSAGGFNVAYANVHLAYHLYY